MTLCSIDTDLQWTRAWHKPQKETPVTSLATSELKQASANRKRWRFEQAAAIIQPAELFVCALAHMQDRIAELEA